MISPLPQVVVGEMDESIITVAVQTFNTLTELCQGPCVGNQQALVACNVTSHVNKVLQSELKDRDPMLVFELRCAATLTLLSLLEGCNDASRPLSMVSAIDFASMQRTLDSLWDLVKDTISSGVQLTEDQQALMEFAFNLFILMSQLRAFSDDTGLVTALESCRGYEYFRSLLGVVEIARGGYLEKVYFHIPNVCMYLTKDLKNEILYSIDRSSPIAKVTSFHANATEVVAQIKYHQQACPPFLPGLCGGMGSGMGPTFPNQRRSTCTAL